MRITFGSYCSEGSKVIQQTYFPTDFSDFACLREFFQYSQVQNTMVKMLNEQCKTRCVQNVSVKIQDLLSVNFKINKCLDFNSDVAKKINKRLSHVIIFSKVQSFDLFRRTHLF